MSSLTGQRILLGVSGGIAAYKSAVLARLMKKAGAEVRVVMTEGAQAFVTPMTFQALTGEPVRTTLLDSDAEAGMGHIELARWADLIVIAPASADLMARLANGMANDLLTTLCLASPAKRYLAPAMNQAMWAHPATRENLARLTGHGWQMLGPDSGEQACGDVGSGRMLEPEAIMAELERERATQPEDFAQRTVIVTAGPTVEAIDPVRYLTNKSSGKMGFALAEAARARGARVILIAGPVTLDTPSGVERVNVQSARDMLDAACRYAIDADIFIGCAAVADYRVATPAEHKLKKTPGSTGLTLELVENPDIIATVAALPARPFMVGFAAETRELERFATDKLARKGLDMIAANDVLAPDLGFGSDHNAVTLYWQDGDSPRHEALPPATKRTLAHGILSRLMANFSAKASFDDRTPHGQTEA
ncbi:bifunctional phosphopantothenoylcysteine decarboxylase/phosphopantothenate--cysteine ligase CoaBC [Larsenimonas suaedae]|uniref:Coenzyme A biosynthesis bifunctional protein CoaBC n=1 Tax=Larsenimonas suaedae TaxID=1851019 RepID=A0ABU1GWW3_9GAMM|nr:bifunctional phosphopantothenoylcysteine decarboxylase/phosphopantothenate--cysteine ligase CoaBC [Larsenimonas suaedae]MCM2973102.1 bifunctional phosphopantothenoylcysteine decarboxylase/phosphopantothenate--cysteine ligase CoaBC [Larsenimonas suaedae]MDR5896539.1 bifunctional phosphopantothenoylcysteine decarboxylase/phosphopantothenate--cysteine ligase CoaBC [Larsenimonas suaedae]